MENDTVDCFPSAEKIDRINEDRLTSMIEGGLDRAYGDWVIADTHQRNEVVVKPISNTNNTYNNDGAIIMKTQSPFNSEKEMLLLMGARETGTYLSNIFLDKINLIRTFDKELVKKHIHNDDFQAVIKFNLSDYDFQKLPSRKNVYHPEIVDVAPIHSK